LFNSRALTKIQSIIFIIIIGVAALGGAAYAFFSAGDSSSDTIKIGICSDFDLPYGRDTLEGAILAAEHINAEGGILGRQIEIISEDNDYGQRDPTIISATTNRLIHVHNVDFIVGDAGVNSILMQDISAENEIILIYNGFIGPLLGERVMDDYEKYKSWFAVFINSTANIDRILHSIGTLGEYTGFDNVGILANDADWTKEHLEVFNYYLPEVYGFNIVYQGLVLSSEVDFTSYFTAMEKADVEILVILLASQNSILFTKQWYDLELPFVVWGVNLMAQDSQYWEWTEGKCVATSNAARPFVAAYPITDKTIPVREAFVERWGHIPTMGASTTYDAIRFILADAIERAGTFETGAVIKALEETDLYGVDGRVGYTSSHNLMVGEGYGEPLLFQWQEDGSRVPVYPRYVMEEARATYQFPPWSGPWDDIT
jgi:branched-chain amino acid transport system substrate-binding protein